MHNAPPVVFPVGRFVWGPPLAFALAALTICALAVWLVWADASASKCAWALGGWLTASVCAARWTPREFFQEGELAWDGEAWHCETQEGHGGPVELALTLDGGSFMVVSLRSLRRPRQPSLFQFACLHSSDMPSRWHGFRCAVYSRPAAEVRMT